MIDLVVETVLKTGMNVFKLGWLYRSQTYRWWSRSPMMNRILAATMMNTWRELGECGLSGVITLIRWWIQTDGWTDGKTQMMTIPLRPEGPRGKNLIDRFLYRYHRAVSRLPYMHAWVCMREDVYMPAHVLACSACMQPWLPVYAHFISACECVYVYVIIRDYLPSKPRPRCSDIGRVIVAGALNSARMRLCSEK